MSDYQAVEGFPFEQVSNLFDKQSYSCVSPESRRAFDPALAGRRAAAQAEFDKAKDAAMRHLVASFKEKLGPDLRISKQGRVNIKAPEGQSRMYEAVIERILSVTGALQTQTMIRQDVQLRFPELSVPKDWTKALPAWSVRELKLGISNGRYGAAFMGLKVRHGTSLSSLHDAAKAHVEQMRDGFISSKALVTISSDAISIDGLTVKISPTRSNGKTYRYARINADELATHIRQRGAR